MFSHLPDQGTFDWSRSVASMIQTPLSPGFQHCITSLPRTNALPVPCQHVPWHFAAPRSLKPWARAPKNDRTETQPKSPLSTSPARGFCSIDEIPQGAGQLLFDGVVRIVANLRSTSAIYLFVVLNRCAQKCQASRVSVRSAMIPNTVVPLWSLYLS